MSSKSTGTRPSDTSREIREIGRYLNRDRFPTELEADKAKIMFDLFASDVGSTLPGRTAASALLKVEKLGSFAPMEDQVLAQRTLNAPGAALGRPSIPYFNGNR